MSAALDLPGSTPPPALPVYHTERELLEQFGAISLDRQHDLLAVIGENDWQVSLPQGEISFGEGLTFAMQVLGTFSRESGTWLWAWANPHANFAEASLQQARQLLQYGEANNLPRLQEPDFEATTTDLHLLGFIATGLFEASAYYLADYGHGVLLATLTDPRLEAARQHSHLRTFEVFSQIISQFELRHQPALAAYLAAKGYEVSTSAHGLTAHRNGSTVTAAFDELGCVTSFGDSLGRE